MSKPIKIMLTTIIALTIIGIVAIILLLYVDFGSTENGEPTISEMAENSFVTDEITTDLADGNFIRIQFRVVTNDQDTMSQLQSGEQFILNDAIIEELTVMEGDDFRNDLRTIRNNVKTAINERLNEGEVTDVFITQKAVQ
ncbi:flagellar FliL protein [Alkalibacillus flavidus]|uniref:Flagellar protein FliL n=1 Tax=Alkalibacillus flavidus TaxID=546021 RepID=A0ABV2KRD2_9BACI